jgi:hypothetical protein
MSHSKTQSVKMRHKRHATAIIKAYFLSEGSVRVPLKLLPFVQNSSVHCQQIFSKGNGLFFRSLQTKAAWYRTLLRNDTRLKNSYRCLYGKPTGGARGEFRPYQTEQQPAENRHAD